MTLDLIETLKTSIYIQKKPNPKTHFPMFRSILVSVRFLSAGMGFSFRVKALRSLFKTCRIRFVYTCSLHVPFMFPCPNEKKNIYIDMYIYIYTYIYIYIYMYTH